MGYKGMNSIVISRGNEVFFKLNRKPVEDVATFLFLFHKLI